MSNKFSMFLVFVMIVINTNANNFPRSIQKRIDKALVASFGKAHYTLKVLEISDVELQNYPGIEKIRISEISNGISDVGFAGFASSKGKFEMFDYLLVFDSQLVIKKVVVLVYRSAYGGEIMTKYWLKQFEGKSNGQKLEFELDIDSISGATISGPSITKGIKSLSKLLYDMKNDGKI